MLVENRAGGERALGVLILIEIAIFAFTGPNFFSSANAFEIVRLGIELGLLALALTPVIVTGGIDLSVGSMMGLCAVVFGYLWRDWHFSIAAAAFSTLAGRPCAEARSTPSSSRASAAHPSSSPSERIRSFAAVAEGLTRGVDNFSQFPARFLYLGQGYLGGIVPAQTPVFLLFAAFYWLLLHRSIYGRAFRAIGFARRWRALGRHPRPSPTRARLHLVRLHRRRSLADLRRAFRPGPFGRGHRL